MAKFCQQCGAPLNEAHRFCAACGAPIPPPQQPAQPAQPAPAPAPQPAQPAPAPVQQPVQPPMMPPPPPPAPNAYAYPASPNYAAPGAPAPYGTPPKKSKTGLIVGIAAAVLVVALGVLAYFGFRDGGFLRGQGDPTAQPSGWEQTDATTRKTKKTKTAKTTKTTAEPTTTATEAPTTTVTEAPTTTTAAPAATLTPDAVAGTYPYTGTYSEYFGETVVDEGSVVGSIKFTAQGSDLLATFYVGGAEKSTLTMSFDPSIRTATYSVIEESYVESFTVTFYEAGGTIRMAAVLQDDYPYSDIPSSTYRLNGVRES